MRPKRPAAAVIVPILVCLGLGALGGVGHGARDEGRGAGGAGPLRGPAPAAAALLAARRERHAALAGGARGKVLLVTFIYTRCRDLCPRQAAEIKDAVLAAGGGVEVYAISVDPEHDTPERARTWLKRMGVAGGPVHVLLGSRSELAPGLEPVRDRPDRRRAARGARRRRRGARGVRGVRARVRGVRRRGVPRGAARVPRRAVRRARPLPGDRRRQLPRPPASCRRARLRAQRVRAADRQGRTPARRLPVRADHVGPPARRPAGAEGRAVTRR